MLSFLLARLLAINVGINCSGASYPIRGILHCAKFSALRVWPLTIPSILAKLGPVPEVSGEIWNLPSPSFGSLTWSWSHLPPLLAFHP